MSWLLLLRAHWKLALVGILLMALAVQQVRIGQRDNRIERQQVSINELRFERDKLIAAAKEAERLNKEQVQRIVSEQDRISSNVEADLNARLERLRSELRAKAPQRNPQGSGASPDGKAPGATDGEAGVCLAPDELLRAAENEERHDRLIDWVEQQLQVQR